jgi:hypothetical protein
MFGLSLYGHNADDGAEKQCYAVSYWFHVFDLMQS